MSRDREWDLQERQMEAPMISVDWAVTDEELVEGRGDRFGRVDWFRKVADIVRRRRSKTPTDAFDLYKACEIAGYFLKYYQGSGRDPLTFVGRDGQWSHTILNDMAEWQESRSGKIDPLAQAILRESLHEVERTERRGL